MSSELKTKGLLILDLDETLIHTTYHPIPGAELKAKREYFYLYERPYLELFLSRHKDRFHFAIWSASKSDYVNWIITNTVLRNFRFEFIYTRKKCKMRTDKYGQPIYIKALTTELCQYELIVFMDDTPQHIVPIEISLKVPEFRGNKDDCYLKDVNLRSIKRAFS